MKEEKKRPNTRTALMKSGCIAAFYTLNGFFLKVKPAFGIDKVIFSFVQKGQKGQGFDVYMDVDMFDIFCDMILNRELDRKLEGSSQKEPAFSYVTGQNGAKQISIFKGNAGTVFHGWFAEKKLNANVPVAPDQLRIMAKWFRRIIVSYCDELSGYCLDAMRSNARYFEENTDDSDLATADKQQQAAEQNEQPENTGSEGPKPETKIQVPSSAQKKMVKTTTPLKPLGTNGNLCFKAVDKKNTEEVFVIVKDYISAYNQSIWEQFKTQSSAETGVFVTVSYVPLGDRFLITDVTKLGR